MDERDFQAMQDEVISSQPLPKLLTVEQIIDFLNANLAPTTAPPPSWYDIYRYAKDKSKWYEKERTRLISDGAKVDAIKEAVRQINFFDEIREIADVQMLNACLLIAKANGIESPFNDVLQDLDIIKQFGPNIQVGGSLTFTDEKDSLKWEQNSTLPQERFDTLKTLHEAGVRTWASMEPVIYPEQSLEIMELTAEYVDAYKIGKLNHFPRHEAKFDWTKFLNDSIATMRKHDKLFYIKNDLWLHSDENTFLNPHERDMDFMAIKNQFALPTLF